MGAACEKERNPNAWGPSRREGPSGGCECSRDVAAAGLHCLCAADGADDRDTPRLEPTDGAAASDPIRRGFLARFQGAGGAGESVGDRHRREAAQKRLRAAYYREQEIPVPLLEGAVPPLRRPGQAPGCTVAQPGGGRSDTVTDAAAVAHFAPAPCPESAFDKRLRALTLSDFEADLRRRDSHPNAADAADSGVLVLTPRCSLPVPRVRGTLTSPQFASSEAGLLRGDPAHPDAAADPGVLVCLIKSPPHSSRPVSRMQGSLLNSPQFAKGTQRAVSKSPGESRLL